MDKKFKKIKDDILGKEYELSLVFAKDSLMKKLNLTYRKKNKSTNVLSFSLSENEGEIFIRESDKKDALFLFIHSLLHLKGYEHCAKMEIQEDILMKKYK